MKRQKMTDREFQQRIKEVGYVEACVESARRDGGVFDEGAIRRDAKAAYQTLQRLQGGTA